MLHKSSSSIILRLSVILYSVLCVKCESNNSFIPYKASSSRLFPLVTFVNFANTECVDTTGGIGTCYTEKRCASLSGTKEGDCASGYATCCRFSQTCGGTITRNLTYFTNIGYPSSYTPVTVPYQCSVTVIPLPGVCQIRLDFSTFLLDYPDSMTGVCRDTFTVGGVTKKAIPAICGENNENHMYIDVESGKTLMLTMTLRTQSTSVERKWNILVTQIPCKSLYKAPEGCLQYFQEETSFVEIFGYPYFPHIANLDYTICVRDDYIHDSIVWSSCTDPSGTGSFEMSVGNTTCLEDYIEINGANNVQNNTYNRYCGQSIPTVRVSAKPFVLHVHTDGTETQEEIDTRTNFGFCLMYQLR